MRIDKRDPGTLRPLSAEVDFVGHAEGSVLFSCGKTRILCNASLENSVPRWMKEQNKDGGWITAEYSMLPRSTSTRNDRETRGIRGRTQEIQRLIGRSLRAGFDLDLLGPHTITVDCDVIEADGGTRTASVTGGYIAAAIALQRMCPMVPPEVFLQPVAAISVGIVDGVALTDLCYQEDVRAEVDANVVMDRAGNIIEIQGTAEGKSFSRPQLNELLDLAWNGIQQLFELQDSSIAAARQSGEPLN